MKKNINAFSIVELIIVVTILSILLTISYFSYMWYTNDAKNTVKVTDINRISEASELYQAKTGSFPIPDNKITIKYNWKSVWYQWTVSDDFIKNVLEVWEWYSDEYYWVDYTYSVLSSRLDEFQIWSVIDWDSSFSNNLIIKQANASNPVSYVMWNYNWKMIEGKDLNLLVPGIILSDLSNIDLDYNLLVNFVTNWSENLPASYSWVGLSMTWGLKTAVKLWQQKLAIYYGYPSSLNHDVNAWDLTKVTEDFNQYKYLVLWAWLEDTAHSDHNNMVTIVSNYTWTSYWYVSINQAYSDITTKVDDWLSSWIDWIFLDEDWYDYLVWWWLFSNNIDARNHQNMVYNYIHSKWLKIIANWWEPDDIFWTLSWEAETTLNRITDWYLFESFTYNVLMTPVDDYKNQFNKIDLILKYKEKYNFDLHCVWMLNKNSDIKDYEIENFYTNSKWFCNSIQITNYLFSASWIDNALMINYFKDYN